MVKKCLKPQGGCLKALGNSEVAVESRLLLLSCKHVSSSVEEFHGLLSGKIYKPRLF